MSNLVPFTMLSAVTALDSSLEGWQLLDGPPDAARIQRHQVTFEQPFTSTPLVHVGITGLDVSKEDNVRLRVRARDINESGFVIEAETWLNTRIWAIDVTWLAIGTV
jgi:hypothetical protein